MLSGPNQSVDVCLFVCLFFVCLSVCLFASTFLCLFVSFVCLGGSVACIMYVARFFEPRESLRLYRSRKTSGVFQDFDSSNICSMYTFKPWHLKI